MKVMMLDGNSIVNRAFYGIRLFSNKEGLYTNAVYGFLNILLKFLDEEKPDGVCVAFDVHAPTIRSRKYEAYKAQRTGMPDELAVQMPVLKEVLDAMNICRFELEGYEADDILGTFSRKMTESGGESVIVTGDRDSLQLVGEHSRVKFVSTAMGQTKTIDYTPEIFFEEFGFEPQKLIDYKALMGDPSDNIPGVAGIGKKTASELVQRFGTIQEIYQNLDEIDIKPAVRKKLEAGRDMAFLSYDLATIDCNVPLKLDVNELLSKPYDTKKLYALFLKLEFKSFIEKMSLNSENFQMETEKNDNIPEICLLNKENWQEMLGDITGQCAVVAENALEMLAIYDKKRAYIIKKSNFDLNEYNNLLKFVFSGGIRKIGHDVKKIYTLLMSAGINFTDFEFDTALGAYLLDSTAGNYSLEKTALAYLHRQLPSESIFINGDGLSQDAENDKEKVISRHACAISDLYDKLLPDLEKADMHKLYFTLELPLCRVLAEMEHVGMKVDSGMLQRFSTELSEKIERTQATIYLLAGEEFNVNSTKKLGEILFERLGLPPVKKTKSGYSTDIEVLEKLKDKHPIIRQVIEYRQLTKLRSTYCEGLLKVIGKDGRIHSKFNMMVTATGRLSSTEPNLQNIPVRQELGSEIRKMFVAGDGCVFVDADYSQIELRVLAHISHDKAMINAFKNGEDIHRITASQVFKIAPEDVSPEYRRRAKAVNFGIVYGISEFSLAEDLGIFRSEAKEYISSYLEHYSGIRQYMHDVVEKAKEVGYVTTIMNRRRYLPELKSQNYNIRSFGERAAMNTPVQGSAADIIKLAMLKVSERLKKEGFRAKLILQVHDELIVEAPENEAEEVKKLLTEEMENVVKLDLPLVAEASLGKTWYEAK